MTSNQNKDFDELLNKIDNVYSSYDEDKINKNNYYSCGRQFKQKTEENSYDENIISCLFTKFHSILMCKIEENDCYDYKTHYSSFNFTSLTRILTSNFSDQNVFFENYYFLIEDIKKILKHVSNGTLSIRAINDYFLHKGIEFTYTEPYIKEEREEEEEEIVKEEEEQDDDDIDFYGDQEDVFQKKEEIKKNEPKFYLEVDNIFVVSYREKKPKEIIQVDISNEINENFIRNLRDKYDTARQHGSSLGEYEQILIKRFYDIEEYYMTSDRSPETAKKKDIKRITAGILVYLEFISPQERGVLLVELFYFSKIFYKNCYAEKKELKSPIVSFIKALKKKEKRDKNSKPSYFFQNALSFVRNVIPLNKAVPGKDFFEALKEKFTFLEVSFNGVEKTINEIKINGSDLLSESRILSHLIGNNNVKVNKSEQNMKIQREKKERNEKNKKFINSVSMREQRDDKYDHFDAEYGGKY